MKLNQILIGLVVLGVLATGTAVFISGINEAYPQTSYDETDITVFNKMENISSIMQDTRTNVTSLQSQSGVLDIVGSFFTNAYKVLVTTGASIDLFSSLISVGVSQLPLGGFGTYLTTALNLIVIILIIVGVLMAVVLAKSDRI